MNGNFLRALADPDAKLNFSRRGALGLAGGGAAVALGVGVSGAAHAAPMHAEDVRKKYPKFDWDDPVVNQRILSRMYSTVEPGKMGIMYFIGRGVGTTGPDDYTPLFRMESLATSLSDVLPDGSIRYRAGQIILFTDWNTNEPLDSWKNPYTGEVCEVFHYRDAPLDYTVNPNKLAERYADLNDPSGRRLVIPWSFRQNKAYGDAYVTTKLKNKLDPKIWKRESIGEYWTTFEHYQWQADIDEIVSDVPQIKSFNGDFQTFKPFEPWMLMGQRPGKVFQQKTCMNIPNYDAVPRNVMKYVEKHLAQYLDLSNIPKDAYKLNHQHFAEQRKPKP
jgi:hypothetical protein